MLSTENKPRQQEKKGKKGKKEKKEKKEKKLKKRLHEIENTLVKQAGRFCTPFLKKMIGNYYYLIHFIIMIISGIILLFDNNIYHLFILFCIVFMDCISCVFLHDCPLTPLENKYLNGCFVDEMPTFLSKSNILYKRSHRYESTLEFLTNCASLLYLKIIILILIKLCKYTNTI